MHKITEQDNEEDTEYNRGSSIFQNTANQSEISSRINKQSIASQLKAEEYEQKTSINASNHQRSKSQL